MTKTLHLFEGFGIELEYMIVRKDNLSILPITDEVLKNIAGEYANEVQGDGLDWSNELVLHVIELKTPTPVKSLEGLPSKFHENILRLNEILKEKNGMLM